MAYNFPCRDLPKCAEGKAIEELERVKEYNEIKRIYQEGLILFFEQDFLSTNAKFNDAARRTDRMLEGLSQTYLDRAGDMLRAVVQQKDPKDKTDLSLVDIMIEFAPNSQLRQTLATDRVPDSKRTYDPKIYRYVVARDRIGQSLARGFAYLKDAKAVRQRALSVQKTDPTKGELPADLLPQRIDYYMASIRTARLAKLNAATVFRLKYPHANYPLQHPKGSEESDKGKASPTAEIAGTRLQWGRHPYILQKNLKAAFDLRLPEEYRPDAVDLAGRIYAEEVQRYVRLGINPKMAEELKSTAGKGQ